MSAKFSTLTRRLIGPVGKVTIFTVSLIPAALRSLLRELPNPVVIGFFERAKL
jgi:hypothetical protein